jgi:hypothetical protein
VISFWPLEVLKITEKIVLKIGGRKMKKEEARTIFSNPIWQFLKQINE